MNYSKKDFAYFAALLVAVMSTFLVVCVSVYAIVHMIDGLINAMITHKRIDGSKISFLLLVSLFIGSLFYIRTNSQRRRTFIAIGDNHRTVEPCDRRDEYL